MPTAATADSRGGRRTRALAAGTSPKQSPRVLAIASGGGHWVQLLRLRPAFEGARVTYVSTKAGYRAQLAEEARLAGRDAPRYYSVLDANRWQKARLVVQLAQVLLILLRERPHVVVSTGASLGFFALTIAKRLGRRTVWVDSIANAEEPSLSGRKVGRSADLWLTQWPHLEGSVSVADKRIRYEGAVI